MILHFKDGNLENPTVWKKGTADLNGRYDVQLKKTSRRSHQQNAYYFGVVVSMCREGFKELGHELSVEETHQFLKSKFNYLEAINEQTGEIVQVPISTTRLTKERFWEYVEQVQRFAAQFLGIVIPDPNTQLEAFGQIDDQETSD